MPRALHLLLPLVVLTGCDQVPSAEARHTEPIETATSARPVSPPGRCDRCLSIERCERGRCVANCPRGEIFIPATGREGFVLGRNEQPDRDQPHTVVLTQPFCIDSTEVTVRAYRDCVERRGCEVPKLGDINSNYRYPDREAHPVNMVHLDQAQRFCATLGKSLPTEAQWAWAAGHGDGRKYPWGNEDPTCENGRADFTPGGAPKSAPAGDVGCHGGGTSPAQTHPLGKSSWPNGDIFDLGGNVWEWTRDCSVPYAPEMEYDPQPIIHPNLKTGCWVYALVGGGWNRSQRALEVGWRAAARKDYQVPALGFRCVRDPR